MNRTTRLVAVALVGAVVAAAAALIGASDTVVDLTLLGTALVLSEQFMLRPANRAPLPLSFAMVVVLVRAADLDQFVIVVTVAFAVAVLIKPEPLRLVSRLLLYAERLVEALVAASVFNLVTDSAGNSDARAVVLGALAAAAVVQVVIADALTFARERRVAPLRARGPDLALITSAVLMAVGYSGIDGAGRFGLWGPLLFSIPLLAALYSFELLASTRRSFWQTVGALGTAPELAGLVRPGHVQRVADLATAVADELDLPQAEIEDLETAALLHHLGAVCLDAPTPENPLDAVAVAEAGAAMLRESEALAPAADIVAAEPLLHRAPAASEQRAGSIPGQILKVASAFDELTDGSDVHAAWALEALFTGPLYVYDGRVVGALERVLEGRGVLVART